MIYDPRVVSSSSTVRINLGSKRRIRTVECEKPQGTEQLQNPTYLTLQCCQACRENPSSLAVTQEANPIHSSVSSIFDLPLFIESLRFA